VRRGRIAIDRLEIRLRGVDPAVARRVAARLDGDLLARLTEMEPRGAAVAPGQGENAGPLAVPVGASAPEVGRLIAARLAGVIAGCQSPEKDLLP
jgi:hypothetical protein